MDKMIYLDNAATTKVADSVVDAMLPYFKEYYGNASSIYQLGAKSKEALDESREYIAGTLGAKRTRFILQQAVPSLTTGRSRQQQTLMPKRENTSSHLRSSTMRYCIHASIWKSTAMK